MNQSKFWIPIVVSVIVTPLAWFLGLASAGGGHGNYFLARLLFPYTMLSTATTDAITNFFFAVAIAQFPIYGIVAGIAGLAGRQRLVLSVLAVIHAIAALLSFVFYGESFTG